MIGPGGEGGTPDSTIRLVVVDDHEVLRQGLRFMMRHASEIRIVGEAGDGRAAMTLINDTEPDVVLLDVKMPAMDGLEALREIRSRWADLPVLILTAYDDPEYVEEALQSGASGYLLKSVRPDELIRAVHAVSTGSGYLQAEVTRPVLERFTRRVPTATGVHLSPRETDVVQLLADGLSNRQIARRLSLSETTVKGYLGGLFDKLGAEDRTHAVALALRSRLID